MTERIIYPLFHHRDPKPGCQSGQCIDCAIVDLHAVTPARQCGGGGVDADEHGLEAFAHQLMVRRLAECWACVRHHHIKS